MKKILATAMLCISSFIVNAQVVPSAYDSVQDARFNKVQLHLERFSASHAGGATFWFVGLGAAVVGSVVGSTPVMIGGGVMNFLGTCIMMSAPRHVGRAAMVGRPKTENSSN